MERRHNINQIAEALNLSRNTVSKVVNGKSGVSAKTSNMVKNYLYSHTSHMAKQEDAALNNDLPSTILFSYRLQNVEYINSLLAGVEKEVKRHGYMLVLNIIQDVGCGEVPFPNSAYNSNVRGIISFNIYDPSYWEKACALTIPSVFIDTLSQRNLFVGKTDIILPENENVIHQLVHAMAKDGRKNFGYFGDPFYCYSLHQRWNAFRNILEELDLQLDMENCILDDFDAVSDLDNIEIIRERLSLMKAIPDAYVCASDRQAILLLRALKSLSLKVPDDVAVSGVDNLPECLRISPPLTTVESHSGYQGEIAVKKILERLEDPQKPHEIIHVEGKVIFRGTT